MKNHMSLSDFGSTLILAAAMASCVVGCANDDGGGGGSAAAIPPSQRSWVEEAELLDDPELLLTPKQVAVLHLDRTRGEEHARHVIRYRFDDATTYTFCIPENEPYIRAAELFERGTTTPLLRIVAGGECQTHFVEEGEYELIVEHQGTGIGNSGKKAFVHVPRLKEEPEGLGASVPRIATQQQPPGSAPAPGGSLGGLTVCNALAVLTTVQSSFFLVSASGSPPNVFAQSPSVDLTLGGWQICRDGNGAYELFLTGPTPQALENNTYGSQAMYAETDGRITVHNNSSSPYASPLEMTDLGDWEFQFSTASIVNGQASPANPISLDSNNNLRWSASNPHTVFGIPIKYYLPGVTPPALQMGEISLNHGCGFDTTHGTWVVRANLPNTQSGITGPSTVVGIWYDNPQKGTREFLNQSTTFVSVRTGPQTVASFYAGKNYSGLIQNIGEDTDCGNVFFDQFNSMKVTAARDFIIATNYCRNCNLTGIDLSNLDLTGGFFTGSTFTSADLYNTNFTSADLSSTNISGADIVLDGASFDDAVMSYTNFRYSDLSGASAISSEGLITGGFSARPDLSHATMDVGTFRPSDWNFLNLTSTTVENASGAVLSTNANPVDFSGAIMTGVDLHGAILDGANFGCGTDFGSDTTVCSQLSNINLSRCSLKQAQFVNANLQGAVFDNANLDTANFCNAKLNQSADLNKSATLQGAFMRNANLYQADLTGANLNNVNFFSTATSGICGTTNCAPTKCATAENATLNSAHMANAYLAGTDFSGASCQGVDFSQSFLMGVNFTNTNLSEDANTGDSGNFKQSFLQGANLSAAMNVTDASFDGAYVDTKAATATVKLQSTNTSFPGYTANPSASLGCVQFTYPHASATPSTNNTNTCPNSSTGPCNSQSQWVLPTPTPGCSSIDFNWGVAPTPAPTAGQPED